MSDCSFIAYQTTVAYTEPNPNLPRAGLLIDGANYYVDALLDKPSGGFLWWRLTPNATVRNEGLKKIDQPIWVRVRDTGATSEECQHIPVIAQEN